MALLLESLTWSRLFIYSILFFFVSFAIDFIGQPRYPKQIPVLGYGRGWIAKFRNTLAYFTQHQSWIEEAYEKVRSDFSLRYAHTLLLTTMQ